MEPKVSVIVPIYRVEKYLSTCIESIQKQSLSEIEIILVDDGSPDACGIIADNYAKKDARIKVIHQKNGGLAAARNAGIREVTGEYIGFVDSDDWIRPAMFEKLYSAAKRENADIAVSGHCDVTDGRIVRRRVHPLAGKTVCDSQELDSIRKEFFGHGENDVETEAFPMSVCASIYRTVLITQNNLLFQNVISEDIFFNLSAYGQAKTISFLDRVDYCYRKDNQESITQTFTDQKRAAFRELLVELRRLSENEKDKECLLRAKRSAIDYCRLYVGIVCNASMPAKRKIQEIKLFVEDQTICACWAGYPVQHLPFKQRVFQWAITRKRYLLALVLSWIRLNIKKGKQVLYGCTKRGKEDTLSN